MEAFITGSHAYGKPTSKSDVDLVVRVSPATAKAIREMVASDHRDTDRIADVRVVRFGALNLILTETDEQYAVWRLGTSELERRGVSVNKHAAKEVFDHLRDCVGLEDGRDSGDEE